MRQVYHLLLVSLLFFLTNFVLSSATTEPPLGTPDIYLEKEAFNFGVIQEGEKASHKFIVSNRGNKDLIIEKVRTSCGCTSSVVGNKVVPPGKTTEVELIYDSKGRPGNFSKSAYISSNDPDEPEKTLVISGEVKKELSPPEIFIEELVDIGVVEVKRKNKVELKITNTGEQNLVVTEIKGGLFTTTEDSPPTIARGSSYSLGLNIFPPKKGILSDTITIISNVGLKEVKISGYAVEEGSRGILISGWSKDRQLKIKNEAFSKIKLLGVEGSTLSKEEVGEGEEAILKLTGPEERGGTKVILRIAVPFP